MVQVKLNETIEILPNDEMLFALQVVAALLRCERGQASWGAKLEELQKEVGLKEQDLMAGLYSLQQKEIVDVRAAQESTSGPYTFRVRRIKDFQIQLIPPA